LDQRKGEVRVRGVMARDVERSEVGRVRGEVKEWVERIEGVLRGLVERLREVKEEGGRREVEEGRGKEEEEKVREMLKGYRDAVGTGRAGEGKVDAVTAQAIHIVTGGKDRREGGGGGGGGKDRDLREGKMRKRGGLFGRS
jgi:hypothetical protein